MVEAGWGGGWWVDVVRDLRDYTQVGFWICEADFFGVESIFFFELGWAVLRRV